jgi:spore photoproduct lyase
MYQLKPFQTYLLDTVRSDPDAMRRVADILHACEIPMDEVRVFDRDSAPMVVREISQWSPEKASDEMPWQHQRALVFTRMQIEASDPPSALTEDLPADVSAGQLQHVLGYITAVRNTHAPESDREKNMVCWNTRDFGLMVGCPHGCQYCGVGRNAKMTAMAMNVEEYMDKVVGPTIEANPAQKCFRLIGWGADIATYEPEYGAFAAFLTKLSAYENRYGYFHTAGDNVDWIEHVPHRDRLIGVWSLTCESAGRLIEPGSPSASERIEAARRCQQFDVPVRFKFKPMIPVRNWREEYASVIERIFERTRPESLGFCVLMWMSYEEMDERIDLNVLDPALVEEARRAADDLRGMRTGPFPHEARARVYRFLIDEIRKHDEDVPIYISTESREMWDELAEKLGQNPRHFVCGCNPIEAPGPRMVPSGRITRSTYLPPSERE